MKKFDIDEFNEILAKMAENRERYYESADMMAKRDQMVKDGIAKYGGMTEFLEHMDFELTEMLIDVEEFRENLKRIERDYAAEIEADKKPYLERRKNHPVINSDNNWAKFREDRHKLGLC